MSEISAIAAEARARVIGAANDLLEKTGKMPKVNEVRQLAKVDMNTASEVMREWRKQQTASAVPVAVVIPESLQQATATAIAAIWIQAQELASDNLRNAQASWEMERAELDAMRIELSNEFEAQSGQLQVLQAELDRFNDAAESQDKVISDLKEQLQHLILDAANLNAKASTVDELKRELAESRREAKDYSTKASRLEGMVDTLQKQNDSLIDALKK